VSTKSLDESDGAIAGGVVEMNSSFMSRSEVAGVSFIREGFKFSDRSVFRWTFPSVG
jgi:hypothetical protein